MLFIPLVAFTGITLVAILFYFRVIDIQNIWEGWSLGEAGKYAEYCEHNQMTEVIRQPANSWSNLAFLLFGLICITFAWFDSERPPNSNSNFLIQNPILSILFGVSLAYLCVGSFFYHASLTRVGQHLDMSGVYAVTTIPIVYNLIRYIHQININNVTNTQLFRRKLALAGGLLIVVVDLFFYVFKWSIDAKIVLPILIVIIILSTALYHRRFKIPVHYPLAAITFASLIIAGTLWILDREKIICSPDSPWQGHAVWHVLTAFSSFGIYLTFRNENSETS